MRTFIGFDFCNELKNELLNVQNILKANSDKGSWVNSSNFHMTLKFLGEIDDSKVDYIDNILKEIALKSSPISINLKNLGYFDRRDNEYRVVWVGFGGEIDKLNLTYDILENMMYEIGFTKETRSFNPHITLGRRVQTKANFNILKQMIEPKLGKEYILDNLVLMKSEAIMKNRIYTPIISYNLKQNSKKSHR